MRAEWYVFILIIPFPIFWTNHLERNHSIYNYYWLQDRAIKWILISSTTYIRLKKMFLKSQKSFWQRVLGEISEGVCSFILEGSLRIQLSETHTHIPLSRPGPIRRKPCVLNKQKSPMYRSDEGGASIQVCTWVNVPQTKGMVPSEGQTVSTSNQLDLLLNNKKTEKGNPWTFMYFSSWLALSFINLRSAQERQYNNLIQGKA